MSARPRPSNEQILEAVSTALTRFQFLQEDWALPREDWARFARVAKAAAALSKELRELVEDSSQVHALHRFAEALTPRRPRGVDEEFSLDATLKLIDRLLEDLDALGEAYRLQIKPLSKIKRDPRLELFTLQLLRAWQLHIGVTPTPAELTHALGIAAVRLKSCPNIVVDLHDQPGQIKATLGLLPDLD